VLLLKVTTLCTAFLTATNGYVHLVERLMTRSPGKDEVEGAIHAAARVENLQLLQWFYTTLLRADLPRDLLDLTAERGISSHAPARRMHSLRDGQGGCGYMEVLGFLHDHRSEGCSV
jgi:hypothetical protein